MMKTRVQLLLCAGLALLMPMCQEMEGPLAAGHMVAVDAKADAMLQKARGYMQAKKYGKARKELKSLILKRPFAPCVAEAHYMLGDVYAAEQDYREAFKQYGKVVEEQQGSSFYTAALNRQLAMATAAAEGKLKVKMFGGLWKTEMESGVVKQWLRSIIKNAPYNDMSATAMSIFGRYLVKLNAPDEACAVYSKLVEDYPHSPYAPAAQLTVAQLWASSHTRGSNNNLVNLNKAQDAYEEFTLRYPNHPDAKKALKEASNVKRLLVQQQLEVGRYYLERSREYRAAIFCFEDVIRQESVNPEAAAEARRLLPKARNPKSTSR